MSLQKLCGTTQDPNSLSKTVSATSPILADSRLAVRPSSMNYHLDMETIAEPDDQDSKDFELESNYFLTDIGDGFPNEAPLKDINPIRHGMSEIWITNIFC